MTAQLISDIYRVYITIYVWSIYHVYITIYIWSMYYNICVIYVCFVPCGPAVRLMGMKILNNIINLNQKC